MDVNRSIAKPYIWPGGSWCCQAWLVMAGHGDLAMNTYMASMAGRGLWHRLEYMEI